MSYVNYNPPSVQSITGSASKYKFFGEAILYSEIINLKRNILPELYPEFKEEIKACKIFCKTESWGFQITLKSNNLLFLAWLKVESLEIYKVLSERLTQKKILQVGQKIDFRCLGK